MPTPFSKDIDELGAGLAALEAGDATKAKELLTALQARKTEYLEGK